MQINNIPFRKLSPNAVARMWLPVTIFTPPKNKSIRIFGLIDTGAGECALPAAYAARLGHNLRAGQKKEIHTGNGVTIAYSHTVTVKIFDFPAWKAKIDFIPNLGVTLLGVKNFLGRFRLTIDFPRQVFSLEL